MRTRKYVLCALGLLILVAQFVVLSPASTVEAQYSEGPCFLFPKGTSWTLGGRGYHTGCEDGSCTTVGNIKGWDYIAPAGTPILAPFSGKITFVGHDGVGNTVQRMVSDDGKIEFGHLHSTTKAVGLQHVTAGEVIAYVNSIGKSGGIAHVHGWFEDLTKGENIRNHDQFWACYKGGKPKPTEVPGPKPTPSPEQNPEPKLWWQAIRDWIQQAFDKAVEFVSSITSPSEPTPPPKEGEPTPSPEPSEEPQVYTFSISAQKPGDLDYQHNIRAFFAWPTSGEDLEKMNSMNLEDFEGFWRIYPGERSLNEFFGSENYEEGQGMRVPSTGGIGDGSCNAASFVSYVAGNTGLDVDRDDRNHAPVPGVPDEWLATVCIPTPNYPCEKYKDVRITNSYDYPVRLHWKIQGDEIQLWIEKEVVEVKPPPGELPSIDWTKVAIVLIVLMVISFFVIKILSRRTDTVDPFVLIMDQSGNLKVILKEAIKLAWTWDVLIITLAVILSSTTLELIRVGFLEWIKGETIILNRMIAVLFLSLLVNLFIRAYQANRNRKLGRVKRLPDGTIVREKTKKYDWRKLLWLGAGIAYAVSPLDAAWPVVDDVIVMGIAIWKAIPDYWKRKVNWGCVFLLLIVVLSVVLAVVKIDQAIQQIKEITLVKKVLVFLGIIEEEPTPVEPPPDEPPPDEPPDSGKCDIPYYKEFVRAAKFDGVPVSWVCKDSLDNLITKESGWSTNANNFSSGAFGLFQFLRTTWAKYLPEVPYRTTDPYWQAVGGFRYIRAAYGNPDCAWNFWQATVYKRPTLACPEHVRKATIWIANGWAGY